MTVINFISFSRISRSIEPRFLVVSYSITQTRAISSYQPAMVRLVFIDGMVSVASIRS